MLLTITFIQSAVFIASYVYCARPPPAVFFNDYDEDDCAKLDHVVSHVSHSDTNTMSLDMICRDRGWHHLVSFAHLQSQPIQLTVIRFKTKTIKIAKIEHNFTLINFERERQKGVASLFFESVEDAKKFNKRVYRSLKEKLTFLQTVGRIDKILITLPNRYPTALAIQSANVYYELVRGLRKFVIEADGNPEPVLVFTQREFEITIDGEQVGNIDKVQLRLGGVTAYEIYFDNVEEGNRFADEMSCYSVNGVLSIQ